MGDIDLTEFGSQRAIEKVAIVVIRHVVDVNRRRYFGLDDLDAGSVSPERMEELFEQYRRHDVTDEPAFQRLAERYDLDKTSLNRAPPRPHRPAPPTACLPSAATPSATPPPGFTDRDVPEAGAD